MLPPKIRLSAAEMDLIQNESLILTKNIVIAKTRMLLEAVQEQQLDFIRKQKLPLNHHFETGPKISKGESYRGLPYLILDHPRYTGPDGLFFIRTLFWWGNFFSSTLHLSAHFQQNHKEKIKSLFEKLSGHYIGVSDDPWNHHFGDNNYIRIGTLNKNEFEQYCEKAGHLKIAIWWPLSIWEEAREVLFEEWKFLYGCMT